ncbi:unnamed protein product, partial [Amoebophrya sp. A25]
DYNEAAALLSSEGEKLRMSIEREETERILTFLKSEGGHAYLREQIEQACLATSSDATSEGIQNSSTAASRRMRA